MTTFSIIVPVYNVEKYLSQCIDSILAQTFKDFELLLVDDGSSDSSPLICDEYAAKDNRIKVFHKNNGGVSSARNVGIKNATGEYLWFVDGDDFVEINALEALSIYKDDVVFLGYRFFDGVTKDNIYITNLTELKGETTEQINTVLEYTMVAYLHLFGSAWSKIIKRNLVIANNLFFQEDISFKEDELFLLEVLKFANSVCVCKNVIYNYRRVASSLSRNIKSSYVHETIVRKCLNFAYQLPLNAQLQILFKKRFLKNLILVYHKNRNEECNLIRQWRLIDEIVDIHESYPSKESRSFVKSNKLITFVFYILRKILKNK